MKIDGRRARMLGFAGGLAGASIALLSSTQPWLVAHGDSFGSLAVATDVAAPAVSSLAIASLALVGALAIANTVLRWILGVVSALLGLGIVATTISTLTDQVGAVIPAVSAVSGISGDASVRALVSGMEVTFWPSLALVAGGILVATGGWTLLTAKSWPRSGTKYGGSDAPSATPAVSEWDALSEGDDPTD